MTDRYFYLLVGYSAKNKQKSLSGSFVYRVKSDGMDRNINNSDLTILRAEAKNHSTLEDDGYFMLFLTGVSILGYMTDEEFNNDKM